MHRRSTFRALAGGLPAAALACALAASGCVSPVHPDIHRRTWLELRTKHISLTTDLGLNAAAWRARELEQYWQALADTYALVLPHTPPPTSLFSVVLLRQCSDFEELDRSQQLGGFAINSPDAIRIAVTCASGGSERTLLHELTHVFNYHYFDELPVWLQEGLATYYSTITVRHGQAILGGYPTDMPLKWSVSVWLPTLDQLRHMSYETFHSEPENRHYFAAWKAVHFLNNSSDRLHALFQRYLALQGAGTPESEAWQSTFGQLPQGWLQRRFRDYRFRFHIRLWTTPYQLADPAPPTVRRLRPGEAHALWAELLLAYYPGAAVQQMKIAAKVDPSWPKLLYWQGLLQPPGPEADRLLRRYLKLHPRDPRGWQALVESEMDELVPPKQVMLARRPPAGLAAMEGDVRRLVEVSSTPYALNLIGRYYALRRNPTTGLNFALRAIRADRGCADCWDTLALLYFDQHRSRQALSAEQHAAALFGEEATPVIRKRLARYRAAAAVR